MTVVVLAGYPAAGKTTCADVLGSAGYPVVSMGNEVREEAESRDEDEVWAVAEELRERHGKHGVATLCIEPIREGLEESDLVVLEGSRTIEEVEYLNRELEADVVIFWITANFEDRVRWFSGREGRGKSGEDPEDRLRLRTEREIEAGMDGLKANHDVLIHNNGTIADLAHELTHYTQALTSSPNS